MFNSYKYRNKQYVAKNTNIRIYITYPQRYQSHKAMLFVYKLFDSSKHHALRILDPMVSDKIVTYWHFHVTTRRRNRRITTYKTSSIEVYIPKIFNIESLKQQQTSPSYSIFTESLLCRVPQLGSALFMIFICEKH